MIGIASPEWMENALAGQKPTDFLKETRAVISLGGRLPRGSVEGLPLTRRQFHNSFEMVNDRLIDTSYEITILLEKNGYRAIPFPPEELGGGVDLSNNLAAAAAGLGELAFNGLLLTTECGARVRFSTVLTDAPIKPDPVKEKKLCTYPGCRACADACPANAIVLKHRSTRGARPNGYLVRELCQHYQSSKLKGLRCGLCIQACPVGKKMKTSRDKNLTETLKGFARENGADIVGIASLDRLENAPQGHRPRDYFKDTKSVVSFGIRMPTPNIEGLPDTQREYQVSFLTASKKINRMGYELERFLEDKGYKSVAIGDGCDLVRKGSNRYEVPPYGAALEAEISHSHAAAATGLGELGMSGLFLSKEFGPRVRLNTLLTEAPLIPDPTAPSGLCTFPECKGCIEACPPRAITEGVEFDRMKGNKKGITKQKCNYYQTVVLNGYRCGLCIQVCPVGSNISSKRS